MTSTIKGILVGTGLGIFLTVGIVGYQLQDTNSKLKNQIAQRDKLIKRIQASDSLSCQASERYDSTVTKYITNDCSLLVDGKEISLDKFIDIYIGQQQKREELEIKLSEINKLLGAVDKEVQTQDQEYAAAQDSLNLYRSMLRAVKKNYGLKFQIRHDGKYRITQLEATQIDSAMVLLKVFRHQLSYDSLSHRWIVGH
jgi:hypothetical protein